MLRPSRPMMRPFISSLGSMTTETVVSDDVVRGRALDGHADDALGLPAGLLAGLVLDALDDVGGLDLGLVLHHPHQLLARLLGGEAGDLLELDPLLLEHPLELDLALLQRPSRGRPASGRAA